jgi:parallel beta-helix repeat protein
MNSKFRKTFSAITLLENAKGLIHKNSFEGNTKVNLAFFDTSVGTVTENTISGGPESLGVQLNGNSNVLVEKNSISNVVSGIVFLDAATGDAISNDLSACTNAGIMVSGTAAPNIESNTFINEFVGIGIIYTGNAAGKAFNNKFSNLYLGVSLDDQAAPNIDANEFSQCRTGIFYQGNSSGTASMNNILMGDVGIEVKSPAQPTLTNTYIQAMSFAIQSDPVEWINQISISGNTLQEGPPQVEVYTITPSP